MTYFIVEAPYEKCFDLFFQDELGFPNFYRLNELLPVQEHYQNITLLAPYQTKEATVLEKIGEKINTLGMKCVSFGEGLEAVFAFDSEGKLNIPTHFQQALDHALLQFFHAQESIPITTHNHQPPPVG